MLSRDAPGDSWQRYDSPGSPRFGGRTASISLASFALVCRRGRASQARANERLAMLEFGSEWSPEFRFLYQAAAKMRRETEAEDERKRRSEAGHEREPSAP